MGISQPSSKYLLSLDQGADGSGAALLAFCHKFLVTFYKGLSEGFYRVGGIRGALNEVLVQVRGGVGGSVCAGVTVEHGVVGDVLLGVHLGLEGGREVGLEVMEDDVSVLHPLPGVLGGNH